MNLIERFVFLMNGPVGLPVTYGHKVWFLNLYLLYALPDNASFVLVSLFLGLLESVLSAYQIETETFIKNGAFEPLDKETDAIVDELLANNNVRDAVKLHVTNFPYPAIAIARQLAKPELYISQHFFTSEEARVHLKPLVALVIAEYTEKSTLKRIIMRGALSSATMIGLFAIKPILLARFSHIGTVALLIALATLLETAINYILAEFMRSSFFSRDLHTAHKVGARPLKEALLFLDPTLNYDKSVADLPNWKLIRPRTSDRLERLDTLASSQEPS